jgi:hypothetical protein
MRRFILQENAYFGNLGTMSTSQLQPFFLFSFLFYEPGMRQDSISMNIWNHGADNVHGLEVVER